VKKLRIAMLIRGILPTPLPSDVAYSPTDVAVNIAQGLANRGHEITLFGPQNSAIRFGRLEQSSLAPIVHNDDDFQKLLKSTDLFDHYIPVLYDHALVSKMFEQAANGVYDLLHFHHFESALSYARLYPQVPVAYTLHDVVYPAHRAIINNFMSPNQHFISISDSQRLRAPELPYTATVHNGIDTHQFVPDNQPESYLLYVGRIVPEKGVKEAITIAQQTDSALVIIGQVPEPYTWYFEEMIKPHLNDKIRYLGKIEHEAIVPYFQKAKALLMPLQWDEPFGLTLAEAMACGTPVIAINRGSASELIDDGKNGFLCANIQEMALRVSQLDTVDRKYCRKTAEDHFSIQAMVKQYEAAFTAIATSSNSRTLKP
jgi:glycosyltransferase involved in cell wall biosynthesis